MKKFRVGDLVRYSQHYIDTHGGRSYTKIPVTKMLGIVTDVGIYSDNGQIVYYPDIHWTGAYMSSGCHPDNVDIIPV